MQRVIRYVRNLPNNTFAQRLAVQEEELEMLRTDVNAANMQADDIDERLKEVAKKLDEIRAKLDEIASLLNMANSTASSAYQLAKRIESLVSEVKSKLQMAYDLLSNEGQPKVNSAQQATTEIMTLADQSATLANDAETEASDQETQAARMNSTASMAYETAIEAKMNAEDAVASQNSDKRTLQQLMIAVTNRSLGRDAAKEDVMNAKVEVEMARDDSDNAHTRASEVQIDLGLSEIQQQLAAAQQKTTEIQNRLTYVTDNYSSVVTRINAAYSDITQLSADIVVATDEADDIKTRADNAYTKAMASVEDGRNVIAEAVDMLYILTNFSQVINETRSRAMQALERIGIIEEFSQNATAIAKRILDDHEKAHDDVMMAVQVAEQALSLANDSLTRANEIRNTIVTLLSNANEEKNNADEVKTNAVNVNTTADDLLATCLAGRDAVDDAIAEGHDAVRNQSMCREKIQMSADDVERLRHLIANIERLDPQQVQHLQQMISALDDRITTADLAAVIQALEDQREEDEAEVNQCDEMIMQLEQDIDNLKRAVAVGQDGCVGVGPAP